MSAHDEQLAADYLARIEGIEREHRRRVRQIKWRTFAMIMLIVIAAILALFL